MRYSIMMVLMLAAYAGAQPAGQKKAEGKPKHEASEDKARTVPGGAGKGVKACHADIERWCKDVKPGEGRLGACLKGHAKELSKKCLRWASHGGKAHVVEALGRDLDGAAPPAKP